MSVMAARWNLKAACASDVQEEDVGLRALQKPLERHPQEKGEKAGIVYPSLYVTEAQKEETEREGVATLPG